MLARRLGEAGMAGSDSHTATTKPPCIAVVPASSSRQIRTISLRRQAAVMPRQQAANDRGLPSRAQRHPVLRPRAASLPDHLARRISRSWSVVVDPVDLGAQGSQIGRASDPPAAADRPLRRRDIGGDDGHGLRRYP